MIERITATSACVNITYIFFTDFYKDSDNIHKFNQSYQRTPQTSHLQRYHFGHSFKAHAKIPIINIHYAFLHSLSNAVFTVLRLIMMVHAGFYIQLRLIKSSKIFFSATCVQMTAQQFSDIMCYPVEILSNFMDKTIGCFCTRLISYVKFLYQSCQIVTKIYKYLSPVVHCLATPAPISTFVATKY